MALIDLEYAEYYRMFPEREGRTIPYPDWFLAHLQLLERQLAKKIDRLPPSFAHGTEPQKTARSKKRTRIPSE